MSIFRTVGSIFLFWISWYRAGLWHEHPSAWTTDGIIGRCLSCDIRWCGRSHETSLPRSPRTQGLHWQNLPNHKVILVVVKQVRVRVERSYMIALWMIEWICVARSRTVWTQPLDHSYCNLWIILLYRNLSIILSYCNLSWSQVP